MSRHTCTSLNLKPETDEAAARSRCDTSISVTDRSLGRVRSNQFRSQYLFAVSPTQPSGDWNQGRIGKQIPSVCDCDSCVYTNASHTWSTQHIDKRKFHNKKPFLMWRSMQHPPRVTCYIVLPWPEHFVLCWILLCCNETQSADRNQRYVTSL